MIIIIKWSLIGLTEVGTLLIAMHASASDKTARLGSHTTQQSVRRPCAKETTRMHGDMSRAHACTVA